MVLQSDVDPIQRALLCHPRDAFRNQRSIDRQWSAFGYTRAPEYDRAIVEYDGFASLLESFGIEVEFLTTDGEEGLDTLYTRDASIVCAEGAILCNMGKADRRGEPEIHRNAFQRLRIPVHGGITGDGRLEGGDVVWLGDRCVAVGRGYRTNVEGIRQLSDLLEGCVEEIEVVPLPHWRGPGDVFHLMSILSPIDRDLALVYSPLMPVPFRETLVDRGYELVEVPEEEFETLGGNVLAVAPRRCVIVSGNPKTRKELERAGVEVAEFEGGEICLPGAGGPTCLTRPLERG
jgi:N-dimethylarginine dimethylaminohydrolase